LLAVQKERAGFNTTNVYASLMLAAEFSAGSELNTPNGAAQGPAAARGTGLQKPGLGEGVL
jgi:hypothetical protein